MLRKHIFLLTLAAAISTVNLIVIPSRIIAIMMGLIIIFFILFLSDTMLPAVYAFPLLATIIPDNHLSYFPFATLINASFFLIGLYLYQNKL